MAYQQSTISAITDIPALVAAFAASHGWTVDGSTLQRGDDPTAAVFTLAANITGSDHTLTVTASGAPSCVLRSPKLRGTAGSPEVPLPTSLHIFADSDPEPFIAIVVQYDYNQYRHLYIGNLVKYGDYVGGECVSAANVHASNNGFDRFPIHYRFDTNHLFNASSRVMSDTTSGGVRVTHANNPTTWRRFFGTNAFTPMGNFDNATVLGGFGDDVNDGYLARAVSPFSGVNVLVPANLYASMPVTGDTTFVPIGHPAGIRLVNMESFDPGDVINVGADEWMVFPAIRKDPTNLDAPQLPGGWAQYETSGVIGYAYPVG